MRQWVEYQLKKQIKSSDWENKLWRFESVADKLGDAFDRIKQGYVNRTLPYQTENVFLREDYIARTAASTGGEVTENDFRKWVLEYPKLMAGHGHQYMTDFGDDTELVYKTMAEVYKLKPETVRIRIQVEEPGQYFVVHIDRHRYKVWNTDGEEVIYEKVRDQHAHNIYVTFMGDQEMGQIVQYGLKTVDWKMGDTITWEHQSIPHCTANIGYHTNFLMVTTGEPIDYKD